MVVSIDAARARIAQGKPDFVSAKKTQSAESAAAAQVTADEQTLADYVAANPSVEAFVDADPTSDSRARLRADGNIDFDALMNDGTTSTVVTMGRENRRQRLAQVIRAGGARANREAAYRQVFAVLPSIAGATLPAPSTLATLDDESLDKALDQLGSFGLAMTDRGPLVYGGQVVEDCWDGHLYAHSKSGLYAWETWPHKNNVTCVQNQGHRGTCTAFATTAALEMHASIATQWMYDLSEQDLYATFKRPRGEWQHDGAWPDELTLAEATAGYVVPREESWPYNPAYQATHTANTDFHNACAGYAGPCSETAHETPLECVLAGNWYCYWVPPIVTGVIPMFSPSDETLHARLETSLTARQTAVNLAAALLTFGQQQVIVAFDIMPAFDQISPDGYVGGSLAGKSWAGHSTLLVGWIPNSLLPSFVQPAAGGGYFVMKNSWGRGFGDQGYAYVPASYLVNFALDVVAL